jgi:hypothetical protein
MGFMRLLHSEYASRCFSRFLSRFTLLLPHFFCLFLTFTLQANAYGKNVVYPGIEGDTYVNLLLKHVLAYSPEEHYIASAFGANIPKGRNFELMANNDGIDVVAGGSTLERESKYQAIHFPLLKGLNGWRIALVMKDNRELFSNIHSLAQFKRLVAGQYHSWSDTHVLRANGIPVVAGTDFEGLFGMLAKERFDYFPRSVLEVGYEQAAHKDLNIVIEPSVIIHYPTAYYFYVSKENVELATDILKGLEAALLDGSFDRLFMQFHGQAVGLIKDSNRRIFELENPLLSKKTPLSRRELWIDLSQ